MSSRATESNTAQVEMQIGDGQVLQLRAVILRDDPTGAWIVDYRLHNASAITTALVFDRGDAQEVGIGRHALGTIGIPRAMTTDAGDLEIIHAAQPLPNPSPISPPTPLAIELAPSAEISGRFIFSSLFTGQPKRVRWCVGVMALEASDEGMVYETPEGRIRQTGFGVVDRQRMLCTPWYDVAKGVFEA